MEQQLQKLTQAILVRGKLLKQLEVQCAAIQASVEEMKPKPVTPPVQASSSTPPAQASSSTPPAQASSSRSLATGELDALMPTGCSMNCPNDDTDLRTSAFMLDAAPGPPSTAALLDIAITSPEPTDATILVRDGTGELTPTPSGTDIHPVDLGDEHVPNLSNCQLGARKVFDRMCGADGISYDFSTNGLVLTTCCPDKSSTAGIAVVDRAIRRRERAHRVLILAHLENSCGAKEFRQPWPPPMQVDVGCSGVELCPMSWLSCKDYRGGVEWMPLWSPPVPGIMLILEKEFCPAINSTEVILRAQTRGVLNIFYGCDSVVDILEGNRSSPEQSWCISWSLCDLRGVSEFGKWVMVGLVSAEQGVEAMGPFQLVISSGIGFDVVSLSEFFIAYAEVKGYFQGLQVHSSNPNYEMESKEQKPTHQRNQSVDLTSSKVPAETIEAKIVSEHPTDDENEVVENGIINGSLKSSSMSDKEQGVANAGGNARLIGRSETGERGISSRCRPSTSSDENSCSSISNISKPHKANDSQWEVVQMTRTRDGILGPSHFKLLKKLGCGDIGSMYLSELSGTKSYFAMKVMDKAPLASRKKLLRAQTEKEILQCLDHPFLPTLYTHLETDKFSCLVMEFCLGEDLHTLRQRKHGKYFPEQVVKSYVAEILLALEYLHMLGIIYRDLKPENVRICEDGHIMLFDFDLSLRCVVSPTLIRSSNLDTEALRKNSQVYCVQPAWVEPSCMMRPSCAAHNPQVPGIEPSGHCGCILKKSLDEVTAQLEFYKGSWTRTGCSVLADEWTTDKGRTLIYFSVYCPEGPMFLKSIDATDIVASSDALYELMKNVVEEVGEKNIVQVVTNNSEIHVAAGKRLGETFPTLFWSPCTYQCINGMLEDFSKVGAISEIMSNAKAITGFIYSSALSLNLMKKYLHGKDLLIPAETHATMNFVTLKNMYSLKEALQAMVSSDEWIHCLLPKKPGGIEVSNLVNILQFWSSCAAVVRITEPLVHLLKLVGSNKRHAMGYVYAGLYKDKETIKKELVRTSTHHGHFNARGVLALRFLQLPWDPGGQTSMESAWGQAEFHRGKNVMTPQLGRLVAGNGNGLSPSRCSQPRGPSNTNALMLAREKGDKKIIQACLGSLFFQLLLPPNPLL